MANQAAGDRRIADRVRGGMTGPPPGAAGSVALPSGISEREARFLLGTLARVKACRFGRLHVAVSDGRVVDVEVAEKVDRNLLRNLAS